MGRILALPFLFVADRAYSAGNTLFNVFVRLADLYFLTFRMGRLLPVLAQRFRFTADQMYSLGVTSLPLVLITSCFTGGVAVSQAAYQFSNLIPYTYLGTAVCKVTLIELAPVLTALVMAGRIGASIAAELGSMKTNEQVDAMECLALNPIVYLVLPRFAAGMIMEIILTIFADFIAILGAWFVAVVFLDVSSNLFLSGIKLFFTPFDAFAGLIKAGVFGGIITLMGCWHGINAEGGAEGVGKATMKAVVSSCVLILIFDFVVAALII